MAEGPLNAKAIRQAHTSVEVIQIKQYQLATLLHRIYYKSKAQHRSAKWFQSISGMRKGFSRLLNMQKVKSKIDDSLPDRGTSSKAKHQRRGSKKDDKENGSLEGLQQAMGHVWSSLWADNRSQDGSLVKYDTIPSHEPDPTSSLSTAQQLLIVCLQLQELANRSKISFNILQIHLRTPPAPTFAPLILSLLSLCAQIHSACLEALWTDSDKAVSMARLYGVFRLAGGSHIADGALVLDGINRSCKLAIEKTLNMVHSNSKSLMERLPREIVRADLRQTPLVRRETHQVESKFEPLQKSLSSDVLMDDEDLGEAV